MLQKAGEERVRVKYLSFHTVEEDSHSRRATEVTHKALSAWAERHRSWCAALIVTLHRSPRHSDGVNTAVFYCGDTATEVTSAKQDFKQKGMALNEALWFFQAVKRR